MDTNKILSADFLDIIFDDRNKEYGAYELRKTYQNRITKSLVFTGLFVLLAFSGVVLANKLSPKEKSELFIRAVTLVDIPDEIEPPPIPEPPRIIEPPQVQTEEFAQIVVVDDNEVETPLPTQEDLINAKIDFSKNEGVIDEGIIALQNLDDGKNLIEIKTTKLPDGPFEKVEIEAEFIGNWEKFLMRNLNSNILVDNGAPTGNYTVLIKFVVDIDGSISDIMPLTNRGFGLEQEAIRVVKKATKWKPAIQ
ncbi:MAG: energy transducer TonB, partial [Chitinophagaceae bacterium]